jgi:hypothetical protein
MTTLNIVGGISADATRPQHANFGQASYGKRAFSVSAEPCGKNTVWIDGWMRPNGPAPAAEQSRTTQWQLALRPFWSWPLWQSRPFAAASACPARPQYLTRQSQTTSINTYQLGWL